MRSSFRLRQWLPHRGHLPALRPAALLQADDSQLTCLVLNTEDSSQHALLLRTIKRQFPDRSLTVLSLPPLQSDNAHNTLHHQLSQWHKSAANRIKLIPVCLLSKKNTPSKRCWFDQPKQTRFQMGQPVWVDLAADEKTASLTETTFNLITALSKHFERLRNISFAVPDTDREQLIASTLKWEKVKLEMIQASRAQRVDIAEVKRTARQILDSIAANPKPITINIFTPLMSWIWKSICSHLEIRGIERVLSIPKDHQMIFIPCHRSHLDYLLLNWVLHKNGFPLPYVAAGDNLNMPLIGRLLQQAGAVFMRRSFRDDALYTALFQGYMKVLTDARLPFEFFIEGGRSRTGHLLPARLGLLNMLLDNQTRQPQQKLAMIPVWIDYDQTPDATSFVSQLNGQPKQKESLLGTLKSFRLIKRDLGSARLAFADPLFVTKAGTDTHLTAAQIGTEVLKRINQQAQITPNTLLALAVLDQPKQSRTSLQNNLSALLAVSGHLTDYTPCPTRQTADEIISAALQRDQLTAQLDQISVTPEQMAVLWYQRNSTEHCLLLPALYLFLCQRLHNPHALNINRLVRLIYPLLQAEYYLHNDPAELTAKLKKQRQKLLDADLLKAASKRHWHCSDHPAVVILQRLAEGVLIRYAILLSLLLKYPGCSRTELIETCQKTGLRLQQQTGHPVALYADTRALEHLVSLLIQFEIIRENNNQLTLQNLPRDSADKLRDLLPEHVSALF
ncbi:1-acyl-sn-glycerol-3-phosphate acyltransferase [Neptuniibacter sp. CAU 1671]|uniref:1-acyl-sn-glycerol-3-phosphate acyltransferase n=1 Tax=Neptuniibacter sp. CAU 1671 TaxID=3032593 RepID=UPI0023DB39F9|nr:1-acyl-sn-glycerol-3-phosphate acyltransferase [Neptuniibacter sp. CAU 1671]MDF2182231.1 1-acyl-sn-glycerol-3-phosphate acyltransferase [Neptuniibacter sp. CAU 1671]